LDSHCTLSLVGFLKYTWMWIGGLVEGIPGASIIAEKNRFGSFVF
jgi:hypothetical protein